MLGNPVEGERRFRWEGEQFLSPSGMAFGLERNVFHRRTAGAATRDNHPALKLQDIPEPGDRILRPLSCSIMQCTAQPVKSSRTESNGASKTFPSSRLQRTPLPGRVLPARTASSQPEKIRSCCCRKLDSYLRLLQP